MIKRLLFFLLLFISGGLYSQGPAWQWAIEASSSQNEASTDISYDNNSGNAYIGGYFEGGLSVFNSSLVSTNGGQDGFVAKVSSAGVPIWGIRIGSTGQDEVTGVYCSPAGDVYATGFIRGTTDFDPGSGTFTLAPSNTLAEGFIVKYTSAGQFLWAVKFGGSGNDRGNAVFADTSGVYITGAYESSATFPSFTTGTLTTAGSHASTNFFGAKFNHSGTAQWVISGVGSGTEQGNKVVADSSKVYFAGTYNQPMLLYNAAGATVQVLPTQTSGKPDICILSLNKQSGTFAWATNASCTDDMTMGGLVVDATKVYITGSFKNSSISFPYPSPVLTRPNQGGTDIFIAALSKTTGVYQWASSQTGPHTDDVIPADMALSAAGNLIITGSFKSSWSPGPNTVTLTSSGNEDLFLVSFTSGGNFLWAIKAGAGNRDNPAGVSTSTTGSIYVTGKHFNGSQFGETVLTNASGENIFVAKTCAEIISNNVITASQTLCINGTPAPLAGSTPTGGTGSYAYLWQQSTNGTNWIAAAGTNTLITYAPPTLSTTTYYRRNVSVVTSCIYNSNVVTVTTRPTISNAGSNQTVCASSTTIVGNIPPGGFGFWLSSTPGSTVSNPASATTQAMLVPGANVYIWTTFYIGCPTSTSSVIITRDVLPPAAAAGIDQTVCATSATLSGNTTTVGTAFWSVSSGSATIASSISAGTTVNNLNVGLNSFVWSISNGACLATTDTVRITRDDNPTFASAGLDQNLCSTTATLAASLPSFGTPVWSVISGSATVTSPTLNSSPVNSLSAGANFFKWTVSNGVCPVISDTIIIFRYAQPAPASVGGTQTVCATTATLSGSVPTAGSGVWTVLNGTAAVTNNTVNNSTATLGVGFNTFVWTITNGACSPSSATLQIKRDDFPTTATVFTAQPICSSTYTLSGNTPTVGAGLWTTSSGASISTAASATTQVTNLAAGTNQFTWTISNGVCLSSSAVLNINRDLPPTTAIAPANQTICAGSISLTANIPVTGQGLWTSTLTPPYISNPTSPLTGMSNLAIGPNLFFWTISNGVCAPSVSTVTITRDQNPTIAVAGQDQTLCATSVTLSGNTPTVGTGIWTILTGTSSVQTPSNAASPVTNLNVGSNQYIWSISNGTCSTSRDTVRITRDNFPSQAVVGNSVAVCSANATLSATLPAVGTGSWSVLNSPAVIQSATLATTPVNSLSAGMNTFQWQVSNGVCAPSTATTQIQRDLPPGTATIAAVQPVCSTSITLSASQPSVGSGIWSVLGGAGTISNNTLNVTNVTGLSPGINLFQWVQSNGMCTPSSATVQVQRDDFPTVATAGANPTICASGTTLSGNTPTVGNGVWTTSVSGVVITSPNNPFSTVSNLPAGTTPFVWTIANGVCNTSSVTSLIQRDLAPTTAFAGNNQTVCSVSYTLAGNTPTIGQGLWTVISGTPAIITPTLSTSSLNNLGVGNNQLVWTISNGVCAPSSSTVTISRDDFPSAAVVGSSQTLCAGNATITAVTPSIGTGLWQVVSGSAVLNSNTNATTTATNLSAGVNNFIWTVSNGTCSANTATATVQRDANPDQALTGANQTICNLSTTISANSPTVGIGAWSVIIGNAAIVNPNLSSTSVNSLSVGDNVLQWSISNGICAPSTATVLIHRDDFPSIASAGNSQTICGIDATVSAINPITGSGQWTLLNGAGTIQSTGNYSTGISGLAEGYNKFLWSVSNGVCPQNNDTLIIISSYPASAAIAGGDLRICNSVTTLSATAPASGNGKWKLVSGSATISDTTVSNPSLTNLGEGVNVFLWIVNKIYCPLKIDTIKITRDLPPSLALAGDDQQLCGSSATISANNPLKGKGKWMAPNNALISDVNANMTSVSQLVEGENKFIWLITNGVCAPTKDSVSIIASIPPSKAVAGPDVFVCTTSASLSAISPVVGKGYWSFVSGKKVQTDTSKTILLLTDLLPGKNIWKWIVANGICPKESDEVMVTRDTIVTAYAGADQVIETSSALLKAIHLPQIVGTWSQLEGGGRISDVQNPESAVSDLTIGTNTFRWTINSGACPQSTDDVVIYVKPFVIPNGFSPDGDGINDVFKISSLDYYQNVSITIYNRWGLLVYENANYDNRWNGLNNSGEKLADDTYYYILKIDNEKTFTGFVIIKTTK